MVGIAILSWWHVHAADYAREAEAHPDARIVAVWDEDADRGRAAAAQHGAAFHATLEEVLARDDVEGVVVTTPTAAHRAVMEAAAAAGKHIFTEKVLATTLAEAEAIAAAVARAGVTLTVSLPRLSAGYARAIKERIDRGDIGPVTAARVRLAHNGAVGTATDPDGWLPGHFFDPAATGGGALIDLGCHPMYLVRWFLGMPDGLSASYGHVTGRAVEDNAVATLRYATGALGVAEASFVAGSSPFGIEVHGTEGSLLYRSPEGELVRYGKRDGGAASREEIAFPPDLPSPFARWVELAGRGEPDDDNVRLALDLTALMEAANRSAATGREVRLEELSRGR